MINKELIVRKITLIQEDLGNFASFAQYSFSEIAKDYIKQAAMERFLERVVNRAIDINQHLVAELATLETSAPLTYADTFLRLADLGVYPKEFASEILKSAGTRNKLIHEYDTTDPDKIYSSIGDCLRDYHKYCEYILKFTEKADAKN